MKIDIIKKVSVEVTDLEIQGFRNKFPSLTDRGLMSKDSMIAFIIANDKAVDRIAKYDSSIVTETSIDSSLPTNINKF